jgi:hypothetical protein
VDWPQIVSGALLIVALLSVSVYYGFRQVRELRGLRRGPGLPAEEALYQRRRAWRRLAGCGLMLLLAGLLAGALVYLEAPAQRLADQGVPSADAFTPRERDFVRLYGGYWIAFLLLLMAVVFLAAFDLWSTRRWGLRQHRKLQADRRAMIERQVTRLRQERNGHG